MKLRIAAMLVPVAGLLGCPGGDGLTRQGEVPVQPPPARPSALPSPVPGKAPAAGADGMATRVPASPLLFEADWAQTLVGREPEAFRDPARDQANPPYWLAPGRWQVTRIDTPAYRGLAYQAAEEQPQPWLSFRVLHALDLPTRYRVQATVQALSSPHFKAPVGEISIIPYYRDPTRYLEVMFTNDNVGIWLADGAEPDTDRGWTAVHFLPVKTRIGGLQDVTIDMDLQEHRLTVAAGERVYRVTHPFLSPSRPHRVAVRSAGNTFNLVRFRVERAE